MTDSIYQTNFKNSLDFFKSCKQSGPDLIKDIECELYNDFISKVVHFIDFPPLRTWLSQNYHTHTREELYKELCNFYLSQITVAETRAEKNKLLTLAIRSILAVATEGVLSTPVEGLGETYIDKNKNGEFLHIFIKPPIRAGGAGAMGITMLAAEYLAQKLNLKYHASFEQIERYTVEITQYNKLHPQVLIPTDEQIRVLIKTLSICIDGTPSDELCETNRIVEGVDTPYLRGGANLVLIAPFFIKYKKVVKAAKYFGLDFSWLKQLNESPIYKKFQDSDLKEDLIQTAPSLNMLNLDNPSIHKWLQVPKKLGTETYLFYTVAGRPVFSTSTIGGFRLRIGRSRNTGLGTQGLHPFCFALLKFLNVGSQMMISGPCKANSVTPVTDLEVPSVELNNRDFIPLTEATLDYCLLNYKKIYDLGQLLIAYGDFLEANATIPICDYSAEQWRLQYSKYQTELSTLTIDAAVNRTIQLKIVLMPKYTPLLGLITMEGFHYLRTYFKKTFAYDSEIAELLRLLVIHYRVRNEKFEFLSLRLVEEILLLAYPLDLEYASSVVDLVNKYSKLQIGLKGTTYVGGRLASVEACSLSTVKPGLSFIYDIRNYKQTGTDLIKVLDSKKGVSNKIQKVVSITTICPKCKVISCQQFCLICKTRMVLHDSTLVKQEHNLEHDLIIAAKNLNIDLVSTTIKVSNGHLDRLPYWESVEKGLLRSKYGLFVFKDGTIRFSVSNISLTHFKICEINTTVEKLLELGYSVDVNGQPLVNEQQIIKLLVHDVVLPTKILKTFLTVTRFIDELLVRYYRKPKFYNCKQYADLIGHYVVGLAPHILNAIVGRVIGYLDHNGLYAHPIWHAGKRRNADGDKDNIMLLADVLLNFSTVFLKKSAGGLMNVPIMLSSELYVSQVDGEARNVDIMSQYPSTFYQKTEKLAADCPITTIKTIKDSEENLAAYAFTTPTDTICLKTPYNAYKDLETMVEKIDAELELCAKLVCVMELELVTNLLRKHLLRDLRGNSRKFYKQNYRCTKCNIVYTVFPLSMLCTNCKQTLNFTVHLKSISKYRAIVGSLLKHPKLPAAIADEVSLVLEQVNRVDPLLTEKKFTFLKFK